MDASFKFIARLFYTYSNFFIIVILGFNISSVTAQYVAKVIDLTTHKYALNISLPKYTYKQNEPVIVNIELINHDSLNLELWGSFFPERGVASFTIYNKYGKQISLFHGLGIMDWASSRPAFIVEPGDTLFVSMSINDWASEEIKTPENYKDADVYFNSQAYFMPGNYSVVMEKWFQPVNGKGYPGYVKSNKIYFEIVNIDEIDKTILSKVKQYIDKDTSALRDIIRANPDNPLTEHVYMEFLKLTNDDRFYNFEDFINRYPYSPYLTNEIYIAPYIKNLFSGIDNLKNNFDAEFEKIKQQNQNEMLQKFFKEKRRTQLILRLD